MVILAWKLILVVSCLLIGVHVSDGHRAKKVRECRFYFSLYARKAVFVVSDQVRHKLALTATGASYSLGLKYRAIILNMQSKCKGVNEPSRQSSYLLLLFFFFGGGGGGFVRKLCCTIRGCLVMNTVLFKIELNVVSFYIK